MTRGIQTPLGLNALSGMLHGTGLKINPVVASYLGTSNSLAAYTKGSLVSSTGLNALTDAIAAGYALTLTGAMTAPVYANLISIGSSTIPALGNCPPSTYTYNGTSGYGGSKYTGAATQYGFLRLFALQANAEFDYNSTVSLKNEYQDFLASISQAGAYLSTSNEMGVAVKKAQTFMQGTFSNMDDLMSADIAGINLATNLFGQELILSGKAINLAKIRTFGLPSNLLETIQKYHGLTPSLLLALLATGLTKSEISQLIGNGSGIPVSLQKSAYAAFNVIKGPDLQDILTVLNCGTKGLSSLADLLNPQKLFPTSYPSLTVPQYNVSTSENGSKTYYPIYVGSGVSDKLTLLPIKFGTYLDNIVPDDLKLAAGAFSVTMQQVKNITEVPVEKFAQVVANLETTKGLTVTGAAIPADASGLNAIAAKISTGSGPNGALTYSDFFGCMSGLPYNWGEVQSGILSIQTTALLAAYQALYTAVTGPVDPSSLTVDTAVQIQIDAINALISAIAATKNPAVATLNSLWADAGTQLATEQTSRDNGLYALPVPRDGKLNLSPLTQISFIDSLPQAALEPHPHMLAQTVEAISDLSTTAGQSLVAMLRHERNRARLAEAGIPLDDGVPVTLSKAEQKELIANGSIGESSFANLQQLSPKGLLVTPVPTGVYDPNSSAYIVNGAAIPTGGPVVPGSLAGSEYTGLLDPGLDVNLASSGTLPSTYTVDEALDKVTVCNCECWLGN